MYEYKTLKFNTSGFWGGKINNQEIEIELNNLGKDGWELVSVVSSNEGYGNTKEIICFLKRNLK